MMTRRYAQTTRVVKPGNEEEFVGRWGVFAD